MQTEMNAVPESAVGGSADLGRMRKFGTTEANQGEVERSSLNHSPVAAVASLLRLYIIVSVYVVRYVIWRGGGMTLEMEPGFRDIFR